MKRICILLLLTMGFTSTSLDNKAEDIVSAKPITDYSINIDTISIKIKTLDSLLTELNKHTHDNKKNSKD